MFRASFPWRLETAYLREKLHTHIDATVLATLEWGQAKRR